ncbi:hypothetical protein F444_22510 [Phytophthora nicotianae P1976]|uniref:Uncharacterized protein n=1 Tax=Phytophthora nicotianae P1976 TaxID=1317066 RepID=A0A080YXK6_PHYNI|nr:hypothetical protein F444_22510 [Phytophthora nicotianae P1976]
MTSSAPTTSSTVVDHGFTDAHEYEEEYAYEERAPVPTPTNKIKAKPKSKKTALEKRPSTPPGHVQISAAPPKAGASPAQGHPSDEILQRTGTKIARKMTKGSVCVKTRKSSSSRLNRQISPARALIHGTNPPGHDGSAVSRKMNCPHDSYRLDSSSGQDVEIVSDEAGASGDLYRLNTLAFVCMNTSRFYKKKASSLNSGVKQVGDGGAEVDERDAYLESEE